MKTRQAGQRRGRKCHRKAMLWRSKSAGPGKTACKGPKLRRQKGSAGKNLRRLKGSAAKTACKSLPMLRLK